MSSEDGERNLGSVQIIGTNHGLTKSWQMLPGSQIEVITRSTAAKQREMFRWQLAVRTVLNDSGAIRVERIAKCRLTRHTDQELRHEAASSGSVHWVRCHMQYPQHSGECAKQELEASESSHGFFWYSSAMGSPGGKAPYQSWQGKQRDGGFYGHKSDSFSVNPWANGQSIDTHCGQGDISTLCSDLLDR
ncbi:hypothetical protein MG293_018997 [Ovis ammon polii]|uniref:Uncharacterized protein n=1 Tax=Ovis ammon polii TaxID=230172 RepID=A0AAD4TRV8_OVIAM|nr:hypothetical protein MG293_018997 [Ovis ammon polii]